MPPSLHIPAQMTIRSRGVRPVPTYWMWRCNRCNEADLWCRGFDEALAGATEHLRHPCGNELREPIYDDPPVGLTLGQWTVLLLLVALLMAAGIFIYVDSQSLNPVIFDRASW